MQSGDIGSREPGTGTGAALLHLLQNLIRVDTSNPPGNETAAALVLKDYLAAEGIEARLLGELPQRQNLVARVRGGCGGPTLLLLGHLDVVPSGDESEWSVPPFSGEFRDGYVWGRGASDMKSQVAAEAVALVHLSRARADLAGEVVFVATVDEETRRDCGAEWLCAEAPDLVRCDFLVTEGMGGLWLPAESGRVYLLSVGEKGFAQFRLRVRGRGGHSAIPNRADNPVINLARAVTALAELETPAEVGPLLRDFLDAVVDNHELAPLLKDPSQVRAACRRLSDLQPEVAKLVEPWLGITVAPTVLRAGTLTNVVPTYAEAEIDARILPGQTPDDVRDLVKAGLDALGVEFEIEWINTVIPNASPADSPLAECIASIVSEDFPGSRLVPMVSGCYTDACWFRKAFPEAVVYGFAPYAEESIVDLGLGRDHAPDERILLADAAYQAAFYEKVARRLLA